MKKFSIVMLSLAVLVLVACGGKTSEGGNTSEGSEESRDGKCPDSNRFCHSRDNLKWSDRSASGMNWDDAVKYCEGFGGRLPTIGELRSLVQNCPATTTGGDCGVTDNCIANDCWREKDCVGCSPNHKGKYSVFGDHGMVWSSSTQKDSDSAWSVTFFDGRVVNLLKSLENEVRCVQK